MAKGSEATKKSAAVPDELYDTLNTEEQQAWDLIGSLGFRPDRDNDLRWHALAIQGDQKIGPSATIFDLAAVVQATVGGDDSMKIKADSKGNRYLEGMEPVVDAEIATAAGNYHAIKSERCALTTREVAAKEALVEVCHRKKDLFKADPDNTNAKIYKVGDLVVRIANEFKEKISTEIVELED